MVDITPIILCVISLIGAIIVTLLVPYIKSMLAGDRLEKLRMWVKVFVQAAEQLFVGSGRGEEKLAWVAERLREKGYEFDVTSTADAIRAMIEAAVLELDRAK